MVMLFYRDVMSRLRRIIASGAEMGSEPLWEKLGSRQPHDRLGGHGRQTPLDQKPIQRKNGCFDKVQKGTRLELNQLLIPPARHGMARNFLIITEEYLAQSVADYRVRR